MEPPQKVTAADIAAALLLDDGTPHQIASPATSASEKHAHPRSTVDFVLLSEFSELEGPVPLFRIPDSAAPTFNVNDFVLRIMAVDHQASKAKEHACIIPDTQVVLSEPDENIHAYIHHFSLLDIHARGYVRPYAMVYLSESPVKIATQFEGLLKQFSSVSAMLKESNSALFIKELEGRVSDMRQTVEWIGSNPSTSLAHEAEERLLAEAAMTETAPTTLKDYLNDMEELLKRLRFHLLPAQPSGEDSSSSVSVTSLTTTAPSSLGGSATSVNSHISIETLQAAIPSSTSSSSPPLSGMVTPSSLPDISQATEALPASATVTPAPLSVLSPLPKAVPKSQILEHLSSVQGVRNFEKRLRTINELCAGTIAPVMAKFRAIQKHFSKSVLELRMETEERRMVAYRLSALHIGPKILLNYADHMSRTPAGTSASDSLPSSAKSSMKSLSHYSSNAMSYSTVSPSSNSASMTSLPSVRISMPDMQAVAAGMRTPPSNVSPGTSPSHHSVPLFPASAPTSPMVLPPTALCFWDLRWHSETTTGGLRHSVDQVLRGEGEQNPSVSSSASKGIEKEDSNGTFIHRRSSEAEVMLTASPSAGPGKTILDLRSRYPFLKHMIFSLLKGRPLVIIANPINEGAVRHLTRVLAFFVPRNCTRSVSVVVPWRRGPVRVMDLQFKLIGMSKGHVISKAVERHASILDYEQDFLKAPYYKGELIDDLINPRKNWPDMDTYLNWAYYRMLSLACKSCLYYHQTCSGKISPQDAALAASASTTHHAMPAQLHTSDPDLAALALRRTASDPQLHTSGEPKVIGTASSATLAAPPAVIMPGREVGRPRMLREWGVADSDAEILEHWVETVKEQQANFENLECAPVIRIDHSSSKVFRATRGARV